MARSADGDAPTASEFVPCSNSAEAGGCRKPIRLTLRPTADGGVAVVEFEPYEETVVEHGYVCDACGHRETAERAIVRHLAAHGSGE